MLYYQYYYNLYVVITQNFGLVMIIFKSSNSYNSWRLKMIMPRHKRSTTSIREMSIGQVACENSA